MIFNINAMFDKIEAQLYLVGEYQIASRLVKMK